MPARTKGLLTGASTPASSQPFPAGPCPTCRHRSRLPTPEPVNDRELIGRVLAGDPDAERALYDAHVDRVFRLVYRMAGDLDRAQDWVQETFIRAFERLGQFRGESSLSTWLCSIAMSVSLNGLRKVKRFREREVALEDAGSIGTMPREADPDLKVRLHRAIED